jgi:hypothetical protein
MELRCDVSRYRLCHTLLNAVIQCVHIMTAQVYLETERAQPFTQEPYIQPVGSTNVSTQRVRKSMTRLCKGVDHLKP